jgi:UDP-glucose 4-epimerase
MTILVTGSAGHLGEALMRILRAQGRAAIGLDIKASPFTDVIGSICDRTTVRRCLEGVRAVIHSATLHKPHIITHSRQQFIDTNVSGTLVLLEEALAAGVSAFVYTSTTSAFGAALTPEPGAPAAWITEDVRPIPKNIYGATKAAAEDLCRLFAARERLPMVMLRTSRFFPEEDDNRSTRQSYELANVQANELLYRRADIADVADAHLLAIERAGAIDPGPYIVSATTPFAPEHLALLHEDAPRVVDALFPECAEFYASRGWSMFPRIERVYVNRRARETLGWQPKVDFRHVLDCLGANEDFLSPLAREVGSKGYHDEKFAEGPYPVA